MADEYDINPRHKIFADEWLTGEHTGKPFHGLAAYEYAGYVINEANPYANASKLLRHPKVQAYLKKRMEEMAMTADEVLMRFSMVARSQVGDVVTLTPTGHLTFDAQKVMENRHLIRSFGFDSNGQPKVEFHDSMDALKQVARVLGMLKDGLELSGPGGAPVSMKVEFVNPDGSAANLGPTNAPDAEEEDFSEYDD